MRTAETGREIKHVRILRWFGVKRRTSIIKKCRVGLHLDFIGLPLQLYYTVYL
jgi:hypothetical protein